MKTFVAAALASSLVSFARAAPVNSGLVAITTIEASKFDTNLSAQGGCDPSGCDAGNTVDGPTFALDPESRWSCKPSLEPAGSDCVISYTLNDPFLVDRVELALFKGDERTRTIDVLVDGELVTTWTSSGTTAGFEIVPLGVEGEKIELVGVLSDNEWLSIVQTEIFVEPNAIFEAGELGTVTATSDLFDTNTASSGGCDPAGCNAENTRDGDLSGASRWSCAPKLGGACRIDYDLDTFRTIIGLRLAMYLGSTRSRSLDVFVDDEFVRTWTSSGTTEDFEDVDFEAPVSGGRKVSIESVGGDNEWLSIVETEIIVL